MRGVKGMVGKLVIDWKDVMNFWVCSNIFCWLINSKLKE